MDIPHAVEITSVIPDAIKVEAKDLKEHDVVFDVYGGQHRLRKVLALKDAVRTIREDGRWDYWPHGTVITILRGGEV